MLASIAHCTARSVFKVRTIAAYSLAIPELWQQETQQRKIRLCHPLRSNTFT
jgi:hypothetical protein